VRGGPLNSVDFVKSVAGCKIAFNHMGHPMAPQMEELCNSRVFELLGCGACQIVDAKKDVVKLFKSGRELLYFRDQAEMLALVKRYLADDGERRALGARAREAALASHTYAQRLTELLAACGRAA
jgi:spore maturation protein CgeB